jgi:transposase-like protein
MIQKTSATAAEAGITSVKAPAERVVRDIRRLERKRRSAEDKIRVVLEGLRGEESIAAQCRREGIAESLYCDWSKGVPRGRQTPLGRRHGVQRPPTRRKRCATSPARRTRSSRSGRSNCAIEKA